MRAREATAVERLERAMHSDDPCFGAPALDEGRTCPTDTGPPVPAPALAAKDKSEAYASVSHGKDCWSYLPSFGDVSCDFGDPDGDVTVALVGNSPRRPVAPGAAGDRREAPLACSHLPRLALCDVGAAPAVRHRGPEHRLS